MPLDVYLFAATSGGRWRVGRFGGLTLTRTCRVMPNDAVGPPMGGEHVGILDRISSA